MLSQDLTHNTFGEEIDHHCLINLPTTVVKKMKVGKAGFQSWVMIIFILSQTHGPYHEPGTDFQGVGGDMSPNFWTMGTTISFAPQYSDAVVQISTMTQARLNHVVI